MAGTTATVTIKGIFDASDIQNKVKQIQNVLNNIKMPDKLKSDFVKSFEGLDKALNEFQNKVNKGINNKQDAKSINSSYASIIKEFEKVEQVVERIKTETNGAVDLSNFIKIDDSVVKKLNIITKEIEDLQKQLNSINTSGLEKIYKEFDKLKTEASKSKIQDALKAFGEAKNFEDIEKAIEMIKQAEQSYANLAKSNTPGGQTARQTIAIYEEIINKMREVQQAGQGLQDKMDLKINEKINLSTQELEKQKNAILQGASAFGEYKKQAEGAGGALDKSLSSMGQFGSELEQVKNRIQYFLGLTNAIMLFKRAVRSSINTVKELDKAMTETAVVTNYTVSDMWKQLPEYTKRANKLGVTTKAAYESATLYYQQGLNSEQAAALSTETLKMARIAGLEAAEATDRMTNALRGFNMELNQTSAQRVDDVYSQLAAMSASNVDEISTAMTKVASLAHNANMEFETTAAFLAQIIETTRESAETAGTALKTVVARFSEVKKLFEKNDLKGQDEEGQIIDVNKVGAALRTAGIDLNKYFLGEVGLDDIFMELASKWDSLTSIQQRYIATQAAGSRQQSRFIALMQDYSRTQELVNAAYNSGGASEKQFEKTQDSLESKLARLTNAWNEFLMGIANNKVIKFAVDSLTTILNIVNKLTGALGDVGGSLAKLALVGAGIGGLKAGLNSNWFGNLLKGFSESPIGSFLSGRGFKSAKEEDKAGSTLTTAATTAGSTLETSATAAGGTIETSAATAGGTTESAAMTAANSTVEAASSAGLKATEAATTAANLLVEGATNAKMILSGQSPVGGPGASSGPQLLNGKTPLGITDGSERYSYEEREFGRRIITPDGTEVFEGKNAPHLQIEQPAIDIDYEVVDDINEAVNGIEEPIRNATNIVDDAADVAENAAKTGAEAAAGAGTAAKAGAATALKAVGAAVPWLLAIAVAAFTTYKLWEHFTPEGQLKQAQASADAIKKVENSSDQMSKAAQEAYNTYKEKTSQVESATSVSGKKKAIENRNEYINELLQQDSSYAKYIKTNFENGQIVLSIDENDMKQYAEQADKAAKTNQNSSLLASAMLAESQARVYQSNIDKRQVDFNKGKINDQRVVFNNETGMYDTEFYTRDITDKELASFLGYQAQAAAKSSEAKSIATQAFLKMFDFDNFGGEINDELGELVAGAMAEGFDSKKYLDEINSNKTWLNWSGDTDNQWLGWMRGNKYWKDQYRTIFGAEPDKDLKASEIKEAIAQKQAQDKQQENLDNLSKLVDSNQNLYKPLLQALNGNFGNKIDTQTNIDDYIVDLFKGIDKDTFAKALGKSAEELEELVKNNIQIQKDIVANNAAKLGTKAFKAGVSADVFNKIINFEPEEISKILGFADIAEKSLGEGISDFYNNLPQYIDEGQLDNISNLFKGIDLDQPLVAITKLNKAISDNTNPIVQKLASQIKETNSQILNSGYLTQVFLTSDAYEEVSKSVDKLIKKNEKVTASDIEELAESCSDLKILLDQDEISAQALARAITAISTGKASIEGVTSAVLKTLGATKNTTTAVEEFFKAIDDFDAGKDYGKAVDFANEKIKDLKKSLENLDFGNETFKKNYQYFFKDYENFVKLDTKGRKSLLTTNLERMEKLLDNDALGAMRELSKIEGSGVTKLDKKGYTFNWDVGNETWDTIIKKIQDDLTVNEQVAQTILTAAAKHIPSLMDDLDLNTFEQDIKNFNNNLVNQGAITEQELEVLAQAYGKSTDEIYRQMQKSAKEQGITIPIKVNWQNENGENLSGEKLIQEFNKKFSDKTFLDQYKTRNGYSRPYGPTFSPLYDADEMLKVLQENYKLTSTQAREVADNYVNSVEGQFTKTIEIPVKMENEEGLEEWKIDKVTVKADTIKALEAEVKLKEDEAQWNMLSQSIATALSKATIIPQADPGPAISDIKTAVENEKYTIKVYGKYQGTEGAPKSSGSTESSGSTGSVGARGGKVYSYANGSRHISPGIALTGEEGPELVWNKLRGYAYFTGKNGPEFTNLVPGDQIFPANETRRIVNRGEMPSMAKGGLIYPSYGSGAWPTGKNSKNKGKGKGKKKDDAYDIDLDKYYNMVEDINELIRLRDLLEKDYNQLLKKEWKTGKDIFDILKRQLDLLEERRKITEDLAEKRKQQILDLVKENKQYEKYAWWNDTDQTIEIDWDLVTKITDKDKGGKVKDYLSKLEDLQSKYDEQIEALEDIEDAVQDIRDRGREEYISLEERTRDALMKQIQDKIDELEDVDEAINNTNQKLFDSISQTLELQRQDRDNAKTEEELADKEKRLAYLRQDSSNANRVEIAKLEKELAQEREDYTDTLIDQKISELQRQNEEAAEQRQEQIQLMQRSLDWQEKTGAFWDTVYQYISEGTDAVGGLIHQSDLENLLKKGENWDSLSEAQKEKWAGELIDQVAQGVAFLSINKQLETIGTKEGTEVTFKDKKGVEHTGIVDKKGNVVVQNEDGSTTTYTEVFKDYNNKYRTFEDEGETKPATNTGKGSGGDDGKKGSKSGGGAQYYWKTDTSFWKYDDSYHWHIQRYYQKGYTNPINNKTRVDESTKKAHNWSSIGDGIKQCTICGKTKSVTKKKVNDENNKATYNPASASVGNIIKKYVTQGPMATGGLADFTGPAWLDGTKSKPELVLNSRDTENFIQLKDILADMRKGGNFALSGGDNYYDIDVHVDSLGSDYDVDRAIDRIKARLAQDGAYRNVNTLSRLR